MVRSLRRHSLPARVRMARHPVFNRKVAGVVWFVLSIICIVGLAPLTHEMYKRDFKQHVVAWFVAGVFVLLSVPISLFAILMHLNHWEQPELQRYCIRILGMVPVYSLSCWLALRFKDAAIYLNLFRETYEAYVLYSFTFFLIRCMGTENEACAKLADKPPTPHVFPFCCLPNWTMGEELLSKCKNGVLFFAMTKFFGGVSASILQSMDMLHEVW